MKVFWLFCIQYVIFTSLCCERKDVYHKSVFCETPYMYICRQAGRSYAGICQIHRHRICIKFHKTKKEKSQAIITSKQPNKYAVLFCWILQRYCKMWSQTYAFPADLFRPYFPTTLTPACAVYVFNACHIFRPRILDHRSFWWGRANYKTFQFVMFSIFPQHPQVYVAILANAVWNKRP